MVRFSDILGFVIFQTRQVLSLLSWLEVFNTNGIRNIIYSGMIYVMGYGLQPGLTSLV